jgi:hypothetical protein
MFALGDWLMKSSNSDLRSNPAKVVEVTPDRIRVLWHRKKAGALVPFQLKHISLTSFHSYRAIAAPDMLPAPPPSGPSDLERIAEIQVEAGQIAHVLAEGAEPARLITALADLAGACDRWALALRDGVAAPGHTIDLFQVRAAK